MVATAGKLNLRVKRKVPVDDEPIRCKSRSGLDTSDVDKSTQLQEAVKRCNLRQVQSILSKIRDAKGSTPASLASFVNQVAADGYTALHWALEPPFAEDTLCEDREKIIVSLLEAGADATLKDECETAIGRGESSLMVLARRRVFCEKLGPRILQSIHAENSKRREAANAADNLGETVLMKAAASGCTELVRLLLQSPCYAQTRARSSQDETAPHFACSYGHEAIARLLLEKGASDAVKAADGSGNTPLMCAVQGHFFDKGGATMRALVEACRPCCGALDAQSKAGWTALHFAAARCCPAAVERLLAGGASAEALAYELAYDRALGGPRQLTPLQLAESAAGLLRRMCEALEAEERRRGPLPAKPPREAELPEEDDVPRSTCTCLPFRELLPFQEKIVLGDDDRLVEELGFPDEDTDAHLNAYFAAVVRGGHRDTETTYVTERRGESLVYLRPERSLAVDMPLLEPPRLRPLHLAVYLGHWDVFDALLRQLGADPRLASPALELGDGGPPGGAEETPRELGQRLLRCLERCIATLKNPPPPDPAPPAAAPAPAPTAYYSIFNVRSATGPPSAPPVPPAPRRRRRAPPPAAAAASASRLSAFFASASTSRPSAASSAPSGGALVAAALPASHPAAASSPLALPAPPSAPQAIGKVMDADPPEEGPSAAEALPLAGPAGSAAKAVACIVLDDSDGEDGGSAAGRSPPPRSAPVQQPPAAERPAATANPSARPAKPAGPAAAPVRTASRSPDELPWKAGDGPGVRHEPCTFEDVVRACAAGFGHPLSQLVVTRAPTAPDGRVPLDSGEAGEAASRALEERLWRMPAKARTGLYHTYREAHLRQFGHSRASFAAAFEAFAEGGFPDHPALEIGRLRDKRDPAYGRLLPSFGLFVNSRGPDARRIRAGDILGLYRGLLRKGGLVPGVPPDVAGAGASDTIDGVIKPFLRARYAMRIGLLSKKKGRGKEEEAEEVYIDGHSSRCVLALVNHAARGPPQGAAGPRRANIDIVEVMWRGWPYILYVALEDVPDGSQLLVDYGYRDREEDQMKQLDVCFSFLWEGMTANAKPGVG